MSGAGAGQDPYQEDTLDFDGDDVLNWTKEQFERFIEHGRILFDTPAEAAASSSGRSTAAPNAQQLQDDLKAATEKLDAAKLEQDNLQQAVESSAAVRAELQDSLPDMEVEVRQQHTLEEDVVREHGSVAQLEAAARKQAIERERLEKTLDLCFVVDNTGSMEWCIEAIKTKLSDILDKVQIQHPNVFIRIAYVGYRDHGDKRRFEIMPFVDRKPAEALRTFLEPVQAYGGEDGPEDVVGGVREAVHLTWKSPTKLVILFADYPCHGERYTDLPDDYPGGDPQGETCEQYLRQLASKGVDLHFARITDRTDQMIRIWKEDVYNDNDGCFFEEHSCKDEAADFVPVVLRSLQRSLSRSSTGSGGAGPSNTVKSTQVKNKIARAARHARK